MTAGSRNVEDELHELVRGFVVKLREMVHRQALETVRASLLAPALPTRPTPNTAAKPKAKRPAKPVPKPARVRRSPEQIADAQRHILDHIATNPGQTAEEIRAALGIAKNVWTLTIAGLALEGRVERTGEKRATKYFEPGKAPR